MSCSRGKAHPNAATKLKLFTDSAGFCQNPACNTPLFADGFEDFPHVAEMAHVFAANDGGPRANSQLTKDQRGAYDNIILLCANCHTLVDKTPDSHPADLMIEWKRQHNLKRKQAYGVAKYNSRAEFRAAIDPLLLENGSVHRQIGPDNEYRFNPEAPEADAWKARLKRTIIPNSLRIIMISDRNSELLTESELETVSDFRYHVEGLVMRHLEGHELQNSRFPDAMKELGK